MKARKKNSNDEWKDIVCVRLWKGIVYVQLKDSYHLTSVDQMEFRDDNLSTELKTYDQVDKEKHWQDVRERAAIAAMQGLLANSSLRGNSNEYARVSVEYADALVKQLKGE